MPVDSIARGLAVGGWQSVPFTQAVPLDSFHGKNLGSMYVTGALALSPAANATAGGFAQIRFVADGVNAPTFSGGFKEAGTSSGYINTVGIENILQCWYDGLGYWFSWFQQVGAVALPYPLLSGAAIANGTPTQINLTYTQSLDAAQVPANSSFSIVCSGGAATVTGVSVSGTGVTLTTSRTFLAGDVVTVSYTPPATNFLIDSTDVCQAGSLTNYAITNNVIGVQGVRLTTLANLTETADGVIGWDYVSSDGTVAWNHSMGTSSVKLPAGQDGWVAVKQTVLAVGGSGSMLALKTASTNGNYSTYNYGAYKGSSGFYYQITAGVVNATAVPGANLDFYRLRRAGTTIYAERSTDGGLTYPTNIYTWAGASTADLYISIMTYGVSANAALQGTGNIA